MAKIDKINVGGTLYDINLPTDATPSISGLTVDGDNSRIWLRGQNSYDSFIEFDNAEDALSLGFSNADGTTWNMLINHDGSSGGIDLNGGGLFASTVQTEVLQAP